MLTPRAATGLAPDATTTQSSLTLTSGDDLPAGDGAACRMVRSTSTTSMMATIVEYKTETTHMTVTSTLREPALVPRAENEHQRPRDATSSPDYVEDSTKVRESGARTAEYPLLEARQSFSTLCGTGIYFATVILGETTVTSVISTTMIVPMTVNPPPIILTSVNSLGGTSENGAGTLPSKTPPMASNAVSTVATPVARISSESGRVIENQASETMTTVSEASIEESDPASGISTASVLPVTQTPATDLFPPTTNTSPEETSPPEAGSSNANTSPATVTDSSVTSKSTTTVSSVISSSRPGSGQPESVSQTESIKRLTVVGSGSPSSSLPTRSTQVPVQGTTLVPAAPPVITLGTNTYSPVASSSVYVLNSETLAPGGPAITVSNSVVSLAAGGTQLYVSPTGSVSSGRTASRGTTIELASNSSSRPSILGPTPTPAPITVTIANSPVTINPEASSIVFTPSSGGSPLTILPGSTAITVAGGTIVSLAPANTISQTAAAPAVLVISISGASTVESVTLAASTPPIPTPTTTTIVNPAYIPILVTEPPFVIVDGTVTLTPGGPAATVSDIPLSLGSSTSIFLVGASTITIAPTATDIGGYLYTGLGPDATGSTGPRTIQGMVTLTIPASRNNGSASSNPPTLQRSPSVSGVLQSNGATRSSAMLPWGWASAVFSTLLSPLMRLFVMR